MGQIEMIWETGKNWGLLDITDWMVMFVHHINWKLFGMKQKLEMLCTNRKTFISVQTLKTLLSNQGCPLVPTFSRVLNSFLFNILFGFLDKKKPKMFHFYFIFYYFFCFLKCTFLFFMALRSLCLLMFLHRVFC